MLCVLPVPYVARVASKRVMDVVKDLHAGALSLCILATMRLQIKVSNVSKYRGRFVYKVYGLRIVARIQATAVTAVTTYGQYH